MTCHKNFQVAKLITICSTFDLAYFQIAKLITIYSNLIWQSAGSWLWGLQLSPHIPRPEHSRPCPGCHLDQRKNYKNDKKTKKDKKIKRDKKTVITSHSLARTFLALSRLSDRSMKYVVFTTFPPTWMGKLGFFMFLTFVLLTSPQAWLGIFGVFGGPVLGLFSLGLYVPWASSRL